MAEIRANHPLRRLFAGLTEQTFLSDLGIGDPGLVDYLAGMLARFLHADELYRLRGPGGRRLEEVADMVQEAEALPGDGRTKREYHRHIGDFTLFWTGLFPERLDRVKARARRDFLVDYCATGKRSYLIASTYDDEPFEQEAPVLRRLSAEFELCAFGLTQVRRELQQQEATQGLAALKQLLQ